MVGWCKPCSAFYWIFAPQIPPSLGVEEKEGGRKHCHVRVSNVHEHRPSLCVLRHSQKCHCTLSHFSAFQGFQNFWKSKQISAKFLLFIFHTLWTTIVHAHQGRKKQQLKVPIIFVRDTDFFLFVTCYCIVYYFVASLRTKKGGFLDYETNYIVRFPQEKSKTVNKQLKRERLCWKQRYGWENNARTTYEKLWEETCAGMLVCAKQRRRAPRAHSHENQFHELSLMVGIYQAAPTSPLAVCLLRRFLSQCSRH